MNTTPEPAVSPAPDTEALRAYLRRTIGGDFQARLIAADLLDEDDVLSVLRVFDDVVPAIAEREAGLRADLDRAHAEVERLNKVAGGWWRASQDHARLYSDAAAELARVSGARTIPDDAAEQVMALIERAIANQEPGVGYDDINAVLRSWATPTTDPDVEWEHRHDPAEDIGCSNPPALSCSDAGCPRHGHDTEEGDTDE